MRRHHALAHPAVAARTRMLYSPYSNGAKFNLANNYEE
jgi:hypothetical protein